MAFSIRAEVPGGFNWPSLCELIDNASTYGEERNKAIVREHYAWLLQVTSWKYGINWNPREGYIELELPLSGPLTNIVPEQDYSDLASSVARDQISDILLKIVELVPPRRVISHLKTAPKRNRTGS